MCVCVCVCVRARVCCAPLIASGIHCTMVVSHTLGHGITTQRRYDRRGAAQAISTDYSQQKHTTWAGRGRIIIAQSKANCLSCTAPVVPPLITTEANNTDYGCMQCSGVSCKGMEKHCTKNHQIQLIVD